MKKTGLVILVLLMLLVGGLLWLYAQGPTSRVEFSYQVDTGASGDALLPVSFALIADIHVREDAREEISDEGKTRAILERFITSMNRQLRPDFIVQLGDLNDGCLASCGAGISDDLIVDRLRRAQSYAKAKTDIPWFDVIGNHEYASGYTPGLEVIEGKDFSAIYAAIDDSWSRLEDTWYYRDIHGYRFVFLNTSFPYPGLAHEVPLQQVAWLETVLESSPGPVFVFMHVPVSAGSGSLYDAAVNQEKISRLLAQSDRFVIGFFGHSHHSDAWDGLRRQLDDFGNVFYHTTAPHQWMGNSSLYP